MDNHFNGFPPTASPNLSAQQTSQLRSDEASPQLGWRSTRKPLKWFKAV